MVLKCLGSIHDLLLMLRIVLEYGECWEKSEPLQVC